jgi:hypothetical protein
MMNTGIYLYCFTRTDPALPLAGAGIDDTHQIFRHSCGDVTAVISEVSLEEFCGEIAEARLQDLSWVAPRARRHEEIIEKIMRHAPVLPVRLGTIFSSVHSLTSRMQRHHDAVARFLEEVTDRDEWVIKGIINMEKARDAAVAAAIAKKTEQLQALSPGLRYLEEQRIRKTAEKEFHLWLGAILNSMNKELKSYAADLCERRLQTREVTGSDHEMVANWAFLVPRENVRDLTARISTINSAYESEGLSLELSGPWPPFSFSPALDTETQK